jgi:hypothetical protein
MTARENRQELITPEMAATYLLKNRHNRRLDPAHVRAIARQFTAPGGFPEIPDPIAFDTNDGLLNGQHRLTACAKTGIAFRAVISVGWPPETQLFFDIGKKRTTVDTLQIHGVQNAVAAAAIVRSVFVMAYRDPKQPLTPSQVIDYCQHHPKVQDTAALTHEIPNGVRRPYIGALHLIAVDYLNEQAIADNFVNVFVSGIPAYSGCPAHWAREAIIKASLSARRRYSMTDQICMLMTAFEHFRNNKPVKFVKGAWGIKGFSREIFEQEEARLRGEEAPVAKETSDMPPLSEVSATA